MNENLYNWMIKTQGMPAAEWYRNNPTKPHTSNPHVPPADAKWFPQASVDDPYRQAVASTSDPYKTQTKTAPAASASSQPFDDYLNSIAPKQESGKYAFTSEQDLKDMFPEASYTALEIPKYGRIDISDTGIGYSPDSPQDSWLFHKYINSPEYLNPHNAGEELWKQGQELVKPYSSGETGAAGLKITDFEGYVNSGTAGKYDDLMEQRQRYLEQAWGAASAFNEQWSGKPIEGWENIGFYADLTFPENDIGDIAQLSNTPGPSGFDRQPGSYDPRNIIPIKSPGSNWRPGEGFDIIDPFQDSPVTKPGLSKETDLDEQQTRIASSEYDPQKAKAAATAAKTYKTGSGTEDPFRSQAIFG